ncbi:argininosuccinate synthase, partial [Streptococcus suis]
VYFEFKACIPVAVNVEELSLANLIQRLNFIAGKHGVGRIDHVENRLVGINSREIYECPCAITLMTAHKEIEDLTLVREV